MTRPRNDEPARCPRCGKRIVWHDTERGSRQALDPDPDPRGNVILQRAVAVDSQRPLGGVRAHTLRKDEDAPLAVRYMPHSASCPALQEAAG